MGVFPELFHEKQTRYMKSALHPTRLKWFPISFSGVIKLHYNEIGIEIYNLTLTRMYFKLASAISVVVCVEYNIPTSSDKASKIML